MGFHGGKYTVRAMDFMGEKNSPFQTLRGFLVFFFTTRYEAPALAAATAGISLEVKTGRCPNEYLGWPVSSMMRQSLNS